MLDGLAERARSLIGEAAYFAKSRLAGLVRRLTVRVLEADPAVDAGRVWAWIDWLDGSDDYNDDTRNRLTEIFDKEHALRAALLKHVLLTPCEDGAWMAAHRLIETNLNLHPTPEDLVGVLEALRARVGDGSIDADTWLHNLSYFSERGQQLGIIIRNPDGRITHNFRDTVRR